jgi:predicted nucleotide-binding protein
MAKKTNNPPMREITMLIISRDDFKAQLEDVIEKGTSIYKSRLNPQSIEDVENSKREFETWHDYNCELLKASFNNTSNEYLNDYENAGDLNIPMYLGATKLLSPRDQHTKTWNRFKAKIDNLNLLKNKVNLLKSNGISAGQKNVNNPQNIEPTDEIFIVHGHDDIARLEVSRFLEKLGFKPIVLHEQASGSKTIIEKIEEYSNVGFAVVLYTPCDMGCKKGNESDLKNRARQNVVFEHGYLIGKIGRKNVCALVKENVETPNDISGMVYVPMDPHHGWQLRIAREMKNSGYKVDLNNI